MALNIAIVFTIYSLLFLPLYHWTYLPTEAVGIGLGGMAVIILVSLLYFAKLRYHFRPEQLPRIVWWGFAYYTFLLLTIFLLWGFGCSVSITPLFIIIICLGFTWLHIFQYMVYISCMMAAMLVTISLVEFNYFWVLEFVILYFFAVIVHLFHVRLQCRFFESQHMIETDRNIDGLTGLLNRRALEESFRCRETGIHPQLACILIDLDHFKTVNDTLGHAAGDRVLAHSAGIFRSVFRKDDRICRMGGDEFLILLQLNEGAEEVLTRKLEALLHQVPLCFRGDGGEVTITFSIGACLCQESEDPALEDLIARADTAMYQVKQRGRNAALISGENGFSAVLPGSTTPANIISL